MALDDVQAVVSAVADHRLGQRFVPFHHLGGLTEMTIARRILDEVAID